MRSRTIAIALATAAALLALPAMAQRGWMQEREIRAELTHVMLSGLYPSNIAWVEQINPDGTTDYQEGKERRPGRWSVTGELYCFTYSQPHQGGCFRVVRHSANCYELYTVSIGGVAPSPPPPASAMSWNGRMWRETERATCEEKPIS